MSFDRDRGFGFIRARGYRDDVFVHASSVVGDGPLAAGQKVRFIAEETDRGPRAVRVWPGSIGLTPALASSAFLIVLVAAVAVALRALGFSWLACWLVPINLATFAAWAWDKHRAVRDGRRVPEAALLGLAAIGGGIGAILGVLALRHKRRKSRFLAVLGVVIALELAVVISFVVAA